MNQNINIGIFQFDSNKLEHQISANALRMREFAEENKKLNETLKNTSKEIKDLEGKINSQHKIQERLNKQKAEGTISEKQYQEEMQRSNQRLEELISLQNQTAHAQAQAVIQLNRNTQETKALRLENNELNKLLSAGRTELTETERAYNRLENQLNALKIEAKNYGSVMELLRQEGKENTDEYRKLEEQYNDVSQRANELNNTLKELDKSVGDNHRNVGNYTEAVSGLSDEIQGATGDIVEAVGQISNGNITAGLQGITAGFGGLRTAFMSLTTTMLANPITAILVGITAVATGVGLAVKEFFDYNNQVRELNKEINQLTNYTGAVADEIRINATAISETYGKEFKDVVKEVNSLMTDFGISAEKAFQVYNKGLADGGAINEEFSDSIREYGVLFAQNGYSAEEFINLLNAGIDLDIYSDKLPDAIKEAGLSLTEQTTATRDALVNAFGQPFTDDLLARIEKGQTSVKDALVAISQKSKETNLTLQQQAQLTADVFRGAGEDAGGSLKIFEAINLAHEKEKQQLQGLAKHTAEMTELQRELAHAKDEALKSEGIQSFSQNMEKMWVKAQIIWYGLVDSITEAIQWIDNITGASEVMGETWEVVKGYASAWWEAINSLVDLFGRLLSTLGANNKETQSFAKDIFKFLNPINILKTGLSVLTTLIKGFSNAINSARANIVAFGIVANNIISQVISVANSVKNLDFSGALEKLKNISISKELANARKEAQALNKEIGNKDNNPRNNRPTNNPNANAKTLSEREAEAKAQEEAQKRAEANAKKAQSKAEADRKKAIADKQKAIQEAEKLEKEEAKRSIEIAREKSKLSVDNAKYELAEYIRINAEKYKDDKRWTDEKLKNQIDYYNEVKRRQLEVLHEEERAKNLSIQMKIDEINAKKTLSENDRNEIKNYQEEQKQIQQQFASERAKIEAETNDKIRTDEKAKKEQDLEDEKLSRSIAFQQKIVDLETQNTSEFEIKRQHAQNDRDTELAELDQKLADRLISQENYEAQKTLIESQYAQARKEIDKEVENAKLEGFANVFGQMKGVFGEQTALGKASAIAETTINTYKSATSAYSSLAVIPVVGPALGAAAAALAVASGLKSIQKITSVQTPKAQRGMFIRGKSHAQGGVPILTPNGMIEAEGGEVIINKVSSQLFRGLLSDINVAGGGVKFAQGGVVGSRLAGVQKSLKTETPNITLDNDAISQITNAIYSGSQRGLSDLSENNRIAQGANF